MKKAVAWLQPFIEANKMTSPNPSKGGEFRDGNDAAKREAIYLEGEKKKKAGYVTADPMLYNY